MARFSHAGPSPRSRTCLYIVPMPIFGAGKAPAPLDEGGKRCAAMPARWSGEATKRRTPIEGPAEIVRSGPTAGSAHVRSPVMSLAWRAASASFHGKVTCASPKIVTPVTVFGQKD